MEEKKRYIIRVKGKVQGVFFRKSTQKKAEELDLHGFVENKDDGSVYIQAEGERHKLDELLDWTRKGPDRAQVESAAYEEAELKDYSGFEIKS